MKKIRKKIITTVLCAVIAATAIPVSGMETFYASKGRDGVKVYVMANTTKGVKTKTTRYGLKKGKYVKKVTIRLQEGSFDKSKSTTNGLIKLSKINNPLKAFKGSWKWTYKN